MNDIFKFIFEKNTYRIQAARKLKHIIPIINNKWKFGLPATKNFNINRYSGMYIIEPKYMVNILVLLCVILYNVFFTLLTFVFDLNVSRFCYFKIV